MKRQIRNKYSRQVFLREFLFFHSFWSCLIFFQLCVRTDRRKGEREARTGMDRGRERGLKTGENARTFFIDNLIHN